MNDPITYQGPVTHHGPQPDPAAAERARAEEEAERKQVQANYDRANAERAERRASQP